MTLTNTTFSQTFQGNGATTLFNYNFPIPLATYVQAIYTDANGVMSTLTPNLYTITGLGNPSGGTITYPLTGPAMATGATLQLSRILPLVQLFTLANQGGFYSDVVDAALDYITMVVQQIAGGTFTLNNANLTGVPTAPTANAGTNTTQIATTAFVQAAITGQNFQPLATTLTSLTNLSQTGLIAYTGGGAVAGRSLVAPAAGLTITNPDGVAGAPTFALAGDLAGLEALSGTGFATRTGTSSWITRNMTGTANHIVVTNGDGISAAPTFDVGASVALLDAASQSISGGATIVTNALGTISSGTVTPNPGLRSHQSYTNNGAHTLAPSGNFGDVWVDITNGASAGAITTSGFTKVVGTFDTTNAHKFACMIHISELGSLLMIQAMQ